MAWFFHIIEQNDGRWACCYGWHEHDTHARPQDALAHATQLTTAQRPVEIHLHRQDGTVETMRLPCRGYVHDNESA